VAPAGEGVVCQPQRTGAPSKQAFKSGVVVEDGGVSRKVLNDQEVDVVLQLLGALHGA
jgi:hypothetical protein